MSDDEERLPKKMKSEPIQPRRRVKKIKIPRRAPSIVIPEKQMVYITADKLTCAKCVCFPKDVHEVPKKSNPCQKTPLTLYELAAEVVDSLRLPMAFTWAVEEVMEWMSDVVGLPQYKECILDNHINGMRLIMFEEPSHLVAVNIHNFEHILAITKHVRKLYTLEFVRFCRSIGLPPRKPLTHCTWFQSRSGPSWGIRQNWVRSDFLRWMKILMQAPVYRDHWEMVWYEKPDFPKVMLARVPRAEVERIPHYRPVEKEICREYLTPRRFKFQAGIPDESQLIWMEHPPEPSPVKEKKEEDKKVRSITKDTRLYPKGVCLTDLTGKGLVLARRKMAKPKFLP